MSSVAFKYRNLQGNFLFSLCCVSGRTLGNKMSEKWKSKKLFSLEARTTRKPGQETPSSRKKLGEPLNSIHYISKSKRFSLHCFCKWKTIAWLI